jgi:hypothetical protein
VNEDSRNPDAIGFDRFGLLEHSWQNGADVSRLHESDFGTTG